MSEARNVALDNAAAANRRAESHAESLITERGVVRALDYARRMRESFRPSRGGMNARSLEERAGFNFWVEVASIIEEEWEDTRPFGPDYFEPSGGHSPDLLDSHPMGEVFRVGPSNY